MPPNPPPISMGTTLTEDSVMPRTRAVSVRMPKGAWELHQMVSRPPGDFFWPSGTHQAVAFCGSIYP